VKWKESKKHTTMFIHPSHFSLLIPADSQDCADVCSHRVSALAAWDFDYSPRHELNRIHYNPKNKLIITVYTQDISVNLILLLPCLPQLAPCFLTVIFGTYIPSLPTLRFAAQVYQSAVRRNSPSKTWHSHLAEEVESGPRSDPCI
jgi:hypothetical protein